jgi:hypothetical protein
MQFSSIDQSSIPHVGALGDTIEHLPLESFVEKSEKSKVEFASFSVKQACIPYLRCRDDTHVVPVSDDLGHNQPGSWRGKNLCHVCSAGSSGKHK